MEIKAVQGIKQIENPDLADLLKGMVGEQIKPKLTELAKKTRIPVTTAFDRLGRIEKNFELQCIIKVVEKPYPVSIRGAI